MQGRWRLDDPAGSDAIWIANPFDSKVPDGAEVLDAALAAEFLDGSLQNQEYRGLDALLRIGSEMFAVPHGDAPDVGQLRAMVSTALRSGRLIAFRVKTALKAMEGVGVDDDDAFEAGTRIKDWIEIVLVDEDDKPVPGAAYEITLPDGSSQSGHTNSTGRIRLNGIDAGVCQFTFTDLDEKVWRPA